MKLLHMLRTAIGYAAELRARLRAALTARDQARQAVVDAGAVVERIGGLIAAANEASRRADQADAAHTAALKAWGRNGCDPADAGEHERLATIALEAARAVDVAKATAAEASKNWARAEDAVKARQSDVGHCEVEISSVIGEIIAAEQEPIFERYALVADEYRKLRFQLMAVHRALEPGKYDDYQAKSSAGARLVEDALARGLVLPWDRERDNARGSDFVGGHAGRDEGALEDLIMRHRARALRLRADPES
jgi:hypothetical protein